jgi:DNA replication protein DnaC
VGDGSALLPGQLALRGGRITLFTTNYSDFASTTQETLTDRVSARIRSRLFEMCRRVELRGTDYRKQRLAHQPGRG